jgi:nicotinamidase-related amidase
MIGLLCFVLAVLASPFKSTLWLIIDFQPVQVTSVASMDRRALVANVTAVARTVKLYGLPIVVSTVDVKTGGAAASVTEPNRTFRRR